MSLFSLRAVLLLFLLSGSIEVSAQKPVDVELTKPASDSPSSQTNTAAAHQGGQGIVPLTSQQKLYYGAKKAFLSPSAYLSPAVKALLIERDNVKGFGKTKEDFYADGMSHYARGFATHTTATLLGDGIYPALFKQDPRYHRSGKHGFMARALYAVSRTVVTRGDNGASQPNFSKLLGTLSGHALSNIYERDTVKARDAQGRVLAYHRRVGVRPTLARFGISTALEALTNVALREFDIGGKLSKIFRH